MPNAIVCCSYWAEQAPSTGSEAHIPDRSSAPPDGFRTPESCRWLQDRQQGMRRSTTRGSPHPVAQGAATRLPLYMTTAVPARERVFRYVRKRLLDGEPPTVREVQSAMGYGAVESARKQLEALVAEGRLVKDAGRARGYRLPRDSSRVVSVPIVGRIQAGDLQAAVEDSDGVIAIETRHPSDSLIALRVVGLSMRDRGILPDDIVIVRRTPSADPGSIVAAMVDGEATVKTLRVRGQRVVLEPANPDFESIERDADEVSLVGRVVAVHRDLG